MTILSPLRSRRLAARQTETTQQLITFRLQQEWFALPIESVLKVIPMGDVYGDPKRTGISLTIYQGCELVVVDVGHQIFGEAKSSDFSTQNMLSPTQPEASKLYEQAVSPEQRYLLIVQNSKAELFGLPIDSAPAMRWVPESSFAPLPVTYVAQENIRCVSSLMISATGEHPPLFLLNPNLLVQRQ